VENPNQLRLARAMEELNSTLGSGSRARLAVGAAGKETLQLAEEVKTTMQTLRDATEPIHVNLPGQAISKLTDAMQTLAKKMEGSLGREKAGGANKQIEHDLLQLRMLNHDTLVLMDKLSKQLQSSSESEQPLLSQNKGLRAQAFKDEAALGDSLAELSPEGGRRERGGSARSGRNRLSRGRR
jgi:hypothetical protein